MISDVSDVVRKLWPAGSRLLDVGCGDGAFVGKLQSMGYEAAGCDPQAERIAEALVKVKGAGFAVAGAEALPYADGAFDGCLMVHSLHHVPRHLMQQALAEALRCTKPEGIVAVVEPLAEGSFFHVLRLIDDETTVRHEAQAALEEAERGRLLVQHAEYAWTRREVFADADGLIARMVAAYPARAARAAALKDEIAMRFKSAAVPVAGGWALDQPIRCVAMKRAGKP